MKAIITIDIAGPAGEKSRFKMNLEHFDGMTKEEFQDGISDYKYLLYADIEDAIADLEKQWEDG